MKDLALKLTIASNEFEKNYKETLNSSDVDVKTIHLLYDLGADIKHLMDDVIAAIDSE